MLNENKNEKKPLRVLSRMGARVLTPEEAEQASGGTFLTRCGPAAAVTSGLINKIDQ